MSRVVSFAPATSTIVIPGCATWRRPGIHTPDGCYGFRARSFHSRPGMTSKNSILAASVIRRLAGLRHLAGLGKFLRCHGLRHIAQFRFRRGIAARRGAAEPQEGAYRTARDPLPPAVHHAE